MFLLLFFFRHETCFSLSRAHIRRWIPSCIPGVDICGWFQNEGHYCGRWVKARLARGISFVKGRGVKKGWIGWTDLDGSVGRCNGARGCYLLATVTNRDRTGQGNFFLSSISMSHTETLPLKNQNAISSPRLVSHWPSDGGCWWLR